MNIKRLLPYVLALVVLIIVIINFFTREQSRTTSSDFEALTSGYSMTELSVKQFNNNGALLHTIKATNAEADEDQFRISNVELTTQKDTSSWLIRADHANTDSHFKVLSMYDSVQVSQISNKVPLTLDTQYLNYDAVEGTLETEAPITIKDGSFTFSGVGMMVNLKSQEYSIKSQVKGTTKK